MIYFVSSNKNKFREVKRILDRYNIDIEFKESSLIEIQGEIEEIAKHKIKDAYEIIKDEVIIEDDALFIDELNGFPGVYSSYVYKTIGNDGILKLMKDVKNRGARFVSVIAYSNGYTKLFKGIVEGLIAENRQGISWGYDPIFIPKGYTTTYAMIEKDKISHRSMALKEFVRWYKS